MALDRVGIVLHCLRELTLLNIHRLHAETALLLLQLIVHDFLEAHALKTQQADESIVVALVGEDVVRVEPIVVYIELVEDHIAGGAHLKRQVNSDVCVAEVTRVAESM